MEITGQNQPVELSTPTSANIDFGALKAQAAAMLGSDEPDAPEVPAAVVADPEKVRVKAAEPDKVVASQATPADAEVVVAQKVPANISDDDLVKVTVDGEEQLLPWGEAKGKISGGLKFTKNMQDLAKQKSDWAAEQASLTTLRTERANLEAFLNNEQALTGFVKQKFPHLFTAQSAAAAAVASEAFNPDEIATVGQAKSLAEQQLAGVTQQIADIRANTQKLIADSIRDANQELADKQETAKHAVVLQSTLADIFTKNPVLNSIPNADNLIRFEVSKMQPQTEAEAVAAFQTVASGMVEEIGKHFKANQKIEAVAAAKQKLTSSSIEPAGGATPSLKPTSFKDASGQVNWNKVAQAAKDYS